jgi:hypothetical protein
MNAKKVLSKILTLLSSDEVELTYAKLKDGTIVESATFDVGEDLFVVSEDGTKTPAPDGTHELALKDSEGNEVLIKAITKDGKIVERENVELEDVKVEDIPQASGDKEKANEVKDQSGQVKSGTLMAEETEEVETIPQDDEAPMKEEETTEMGDMKKKIEDLVRVEVLAKHYAPKSLDDLMNRLLTTLVQLALVVPALYMGRIVWHDFLEEMRELVK